MQVELLCINNGLQSSDALLQGLCLAADVGWTAVCHNHEQHGERDQYAANQAKYGETINGFLLLRSDLVEVVDIEIRDGWRRICNRCREWLHGCAVGTWYEPRWIGVDCNHGPRMIEHWW